jgi:hypothetical protein
MNEEAIKERFQGASTRPGYQMAMKHVYGNARSYVKS